ncbi:hypothetical protein FHP29_06375 [Nocardioides albidus]|uniref:Mce-associated membrane protein n=1 Tax=Nocardioides albidus TaxID=1517589 RepID=A0A5C4W5B9_9ACTN|nr:hypothetical protein [Nocardioides albidus]TNM43310.1 hypothetical protein FHP29_06375 [Nocardioides albidus]
MTPLLRSRGPWALLCALLLAVGLLATGCGSASDDKALEDALAKVDELSARDDAEKAAVAAAKEVLVQVTSYSWKDGEHDFAWLDRLSNAELKEKLAANVAKLQEAIVDGKVTAKGQVVDAAGRVVDETQVEVLAFVDQVITDDHNPDVKVDQQRVSMTMKLVKGEWLVDRLDVLTGDNSTEGTQ